MATEIQHKLTDRERRFADAIVEGKAYREAYVSAGYSTSCTIVTQYNNASRIAVKPHVSAYLSEQRSKKAAENKPIQQSITDELTKLAFANIGDLIEVDDEGLPQVDFRKATRDQLAAVTSVSTKKRKIYNAKGDHVATEDTAKFTLADKYRGLELLGRNIGMFKPEETKVTIDVADRLLAARSRYAALVDNSDDDAGS